MMGRPPQDLISIRAEAALKPWLSNTMKDLSSHLLPRFVRPHLLDVESWTSSNTDGQTTVAESYGSERQWKVIGDQATSFLAAVLVLMPVIVLHFVDSSNARLGIIVAFTMAFSLILTSATEAKRSEVFAAVAAFVAVQVVYVGSALNQSNQGQR